MAELVDSKQMESYLFAEMTEEERERFEDLIFEDDEIFLEVVEKENELIDSYVSKGLRQDEIERFEKSLADFPNRRQKIRNARAIWTHIREEKTVEVADSENVTFLSKMSLIFRSPSFAYAMSALFLAAVALSVWLFVDNQNKRNELTRIRNEGTGNQTTWKEKERDLQKELTETREREKELIRRIDGEREASGEIAEELDRERKTKRQLTRELEDLRKQIKRVPGKPGPTVIPHRKEEPPRVASVQLRPGKLRPTDSGMRTTSVGERTVRVSVSLRLPDSVKKDERFSVKLNDKPFLEDVTFRVSGSGVKTIGLSIKRELLLDGRNKLIVINGEGKEVTRYFFSVKKK